MRVREYILTIILLVVVISKMVFSQWSTDPNNTLIVGYGLDPHICSDSAGGCYITYDYDNIYYPRKLGLERLDRYGYKPWGTLKQIIGEFPQQFMAQIVEDGQGGVIVSYIDSYEGSPSYIYNVRVQRIDSSGNFLWGQTGVRVTLDGINNSQQQIVSDGEGGAVVEWINSSAEYKINRVSDEGQRMWGDSGIVLGTNGYYDPVELVRTTNNKYVANAERNVYRYIDGNGNIYNTINVTLGYIIPDNGGGIVLSGRVWSGMIPKLVAQRKDSLGNDLWQEPYVEVGDSLHINTQIRTQNNGDYFYFGWSGKKNGFDQVAQFQASGSDGSILFNQGSIALMRNQKSSLNYMMPSDSLRTIFIYWNDPNLPDSTFAQLYDTLGNKIWNENSILVSHPAIASQNFATDGKGGFIVGGAINEFTIVAQQVNKYGQLGNVIIPVELISFSAEVVNQKIKLSWITATETNNSGFEIQRQETGWEKVGFVKGNGTTTEPASYSFIDRNISAGIYKYRLRQIDYDGMFKYSKEIEVEVNVSAPNEFSLEQNYPNPFNPITNIEYRIPNKEFVSLVVYDVLGNEVEALVNEEKPAGTYSVRFKGSNLPSGVYIYKISAGYNTVVKKLILLK